MPEKTTESTRDQGCQYTNCDKEHPRRSLWGYPFKTSLCTNTQCHDQHADGEGEIEDDDPPGIPHAGISTRRRSPEGRRLENEKRNRREDEEEIAEDSHGDLSLCLFRRQSTEGNGNVVV